MPKRNSIINKEQPITLRRSPRLLLLRNPQESQDSEYPKPKPRSSRAHPSSVSNSRIPYSNSLLSSTSNASLKKTHEDYPENQNEKGGFRSPCFLGEIFLQKEENLHLKAKDHEVFVKMLKRNSIINKEQPITLRRSRRFLLLRSPQESQDSEYPKPKPRSSREHPSSVSNSRIPYSNSLLSSTSNASLKKTHEDYPERDKKKSNKSNDGSNTCAKLISGSRKSPRLNYVVEGFSSLQRSPRFSNGRNTDKHDNSNQFSEEKVLLDVESAKSGVSSCEPLLGKGERRMKSSSLDSEALIVEGGERKGIDIGKGNKLIGVKRKRTRGEECEGLVQGWTKEQEVALQRACFAAKPTPHFWKKVAKLVPGKSAQDCFDKVHSDHLTPSQPRPRSRANRKNLSPMGHFSLSASKLLKPTEPKIKRPRCNKQKSHLAQKTVRQLLQKNYNVDKDYEADLFSVLEPNMNLSSQVFQQSAILSTPEHVPEKLGLLQNFRDISSSGHKKPLSRFISSCGMAFVSPPVLKQVKNRALHEKYIDQLHCREAKRKTASVQAEESVPGNENRKEIHVQKLDAVRVAKNALVSDAMDAIKQFRHLQANPTGNASDLDDNAVDIDDDDDDEVTFGNDI